MWINSKLELMINIRRLKMRRFLKEQKGVNLISLSVAVIVILILTSIILYNAKGNIKIAKLKPLYIVEPPRIYILFMSA